jgi:hypothetical protein
MWTGGLSHAGPGDTPGLHHGHLPTTMATYQHVIPGMRAEATTTFEQLIQETRRSKAGRKPW